MPLQALSLQHTAGGGGGDDKHANLASAQVNIVFAVSESLYWEELRVFLHMHDQLLNPLVIQSFVYFAKMIYPIFSTQLR